MLPIIVPDGEEQWDEARQEFIYPNGMEIKLEHSLMSLSKWEAKWNKPFLAEKKKSFDEMLDYIRCMSLTRDVPEDLYRCLTPSNFREINEYIDAPMTATWFSGQDGWRKGHANGRIVTAELLYCYMIKLGIPFECQKWHLNRLLTLIRVCEEEEKPPKKMSQRTVMSRNTALNTARRKHLNSRG